MSLYLVRVELKKPTRLDHSSYKKLQEKLLAAGFSKILDGEDGVRYVLPPAEYVISTELSVYDVRDKAKALADSVDADNAVVATNATIICWAGLAVAE